MPSKEDLSRLIDAEQESHLLFLQHLIQTPSPNPSADTNAALNVVRDFLKRGGVQPGIISPKPDAPNLVSLLHPKEDPRSLGARSLVFNGHIDQFPVNDSEQWHRDPYSGAIEDGYIHGRGGVDMKAGTAASIIAFAYLHRFREHLSGQCALEVVSDEETGATSRSQGPCHPCPTC
jgi:succinyl-diaminopimelate desuccinylase